MRPVSLPRKVGKTRRTANVPATVVVRKIVFFQGVQTKGPSQKMNGIIRSILRRAIVKM